MIHTIFADRYRITGQLGRGLSGTVYAAQDLETDQEVAMKVPVREQEAQIVERFHHDALPRYLASGSFQEQRFLVMTKINAEPLATFLAQHPCISLLTFGHLVEQLLEIFLHLQQCSVIYADFHDNNILYHPQSGHLSLVDFGWATLGRCRDSTLLLNGIDHYLLPHLEDPSYIAVSAWLLQIRSRYGYEGYTPSLLGIRASWRAFLHQASLSTQAHCA